MRNDTLKKAMDHQLGEMNVTEAQRQALLRRMNEEEPVRIRSKFSLAMAVTIVLVLALGVTAVSATLGIFGQSGHMQDAGNNLEILSEQIHTSACAADTTISVEQAYWEGDILYLAYSLEGEHARVRVWSEPWQKTDDIVFKPQEGDTLSYYSNQLAPGEGMIHHGLIVDDLETLDGEPLPLAMMDYVKGEQRQQIWGLCEYLSEEKASILCLPIYINTTYLWRDEDGNVWYSDSVRELASRLTFQVKHRERDIQRMEGAVEQRNYASEAVMYRGLDSGLCLIRVTTHVPEDWMQGYRSGIRTKMNCVLHASDWMLKTDQGSIVPLPQVTLIYDEEALTFTCYLALEEKNLPDCTQYRLTNELNAQIILLPAE